MHNTYFSNEDLKNLTNEILYFNNIDANIEIVSLKQYLKNKKYKNIFSLLKSTNKLKGLGLLSLTEQRNNSKIVLFSDFYNFKHYSLNDKALISILDSIYHEICHLIQDKYIENDINSFNNFCTFVETFILDIDFKYYIENYKDFFIELDANLYATSKVEEFVIQNFEVREKLLNKLRLDKKYLQFCLDSYDFFPRLEQFFKIIQNNAELQINLNLFYENNNFRNIEDIVNNPMFNLFDKKIIYTIFSSESFLNSQGFINEDSMPIIEESFNFVLENLFNCLNKLDELLRQKIIKISTWEEHYFELSSRINNIESRFKNIKLKRNKRGRI